MKLLLLGSGGREHALAWKICKSSQLEKLYVAPGNAGTSEIAENIAIDINNFEAVGNFCVQNQINIVVVGPEQPLVNGIHNYFETTNTLQNITIIGPKKEGAIIEGSKDFSKAFMKRHRIPTAKSKSFNKNQLPEALAYLEQKESPYVLKADGLAAGKGVIIEKDLKKAKFALKELLKGQFGKSSETVVIEDFLIGVELSVFIITDGVNYKILPEAKDYKRINENDTGLNTGGMGAISPVPFANREFLDKVENQIIIPTVKGLRKESIEYSGFIFFGLISVKGDPYVIEYNCRLGDPETEVIMPRLKSDILELFDGIATNTLSERDVEIDLRSAASVMIVSGGYPENYEKNKEITIGELDEKSMVFHAGTTFKNNKIVSNGGRVLALTSYGKNLETALKSTYKNVGKVHFENQYFRSDIGRDVTKKS
ncbi:MAG: phosphoribosylamine--glycine ligase [Crocinitomicaceae bacterium]|nr:phosphoribosylamine--glycine ligase [Crocinitomicaceae bacterium]|tara:strand:+ start:1531 stop:2811 length:1281 start_codon:yes stop_codon:yes gene_type:complete